MGQKKMTLEKIIGRGAVIACLAGNLGLIGSCIIDENTRPDSYIPDYSQAFREHNDSMNKFYDSSLTLAIVGIATGLASAAYSTYKSGTSI